MTAKNEDGSNPFVPSRYTKYLPAELIQDLVELDAAGTLSRATIIPVLDKHSIYRREGLAHWPWSSQWKTAPKLRDALHLVKKALHDQAREENKLAEEVTDAVLEGADKLMFQRMRDGDVPLTEQHLRQVRDRAVESLIYRFMSTQVIQAKIMQYDTNLTLAMADLEKGERKTYLETFQHFVREARMRP